MPRNLRSSKKFVELELKGIEKNKKLLPRERKKLFKRSLDLNKAVEENQEDIWKGIEKFKDIAKTGEDSSTEDEISEGSKQGSSSSLAWDNQGDLRSPLKDTSDLLDTSFRYEGDQDSLPPALSRDRSVSVSVNRASYLTRETGEILDIQPVCRDLNFRFEEAGQGEPRSLRSQDSFLERNLQDKQIETLNLIREEEEICLDLEERRNEVFVDEELEAIKMEENIYKNHLKKLKSDQRKVQRKISEYTADDVTVEDKDEFRNYLNDARNKFEAFKDAADAVIDLLDIELEALRVEEIEALVKETSTAIKKNEKEVKEKITEVKVQAVVSAPQSEVEKRMDNQKVEKLKKRMEFLKEKAAASELKIEDASPTEMTDNEIREKFVESKDWEKVCKEMIKTKEEIEEDCIGLDIDDILISQMKESVQNSVGALQKRIADLKLEDKSRGLFSAVSKNLSRENVVFPEKFSGELGDNVFRFKEKFLQALLDSQVREKDKVEVLRKHLTGQAKILIGAHYTDIDKALQSLIDYFGDEQRIWDKSKEKFENYFTGNSERVWGKYGDDKRVMAISKVIEFLREAMELAESYEELHGEIYHKSNLTLILKTLPSDYYKKFNDLINGQRIPMKEKFESAKDLLEVEKNSAIHAENFDRDKKFEPRRVGANQFGRYDENFGGKGRGNGNRGDFGSGGGSQGWIERDRRDEYKERGGFDRRGLDRYDRNGHDKFGRSGGLDDNICKFCNGRNCCRPEWDGLGCLELYKLETLQERKDWLLKFRLCVRCGGHFFFPHRCNWLGNNSRVSAKCQTSACNEGAVLCSRQHKMNMSRDLMNWLRSMKINPKDITYSLVVGSNITSNNNSKIKQKKTVSSSIPIPKISKETREKLQKGTIERLMSDDEISDYFEIELKENNVKNPDVRPIPEGEPIFIMNVFKGKTRPIVAFIDGGCNCWVAKQGVPEMELTSVKIRSGPIPCGVASGITVNAIAEWASLIPLADGGVQAVRGLTMKNVTQDMPEVNMLDLFNAIKKDNKDVKSIQNLKPPKILSGQVDMIIGIKYQSIYPELIHQFPNGLAVYKSKLLPACPGQLACIGGPVGALENLCHGFGGNSLRYLVQVTQEMARYTPRMEFFPESKSYEVNLVDDDIPGIFELLDEQNKKNDYKEKYGEALDDKMACEVCEEKFIYSIPATVQSELKRFMQQEQVGLDSNYKCPKCRSCEDCVKGSGFERISIKQEAEQELIKQSVDVNIEAGRAMAKLPFKVSNPEEYLANNTNIAHKRLQNVCRKYFQDEKIKKQVLDAFEKLRSRGHIKLYEDLNRDQRTKLESKTGYTIPWDVVWKETSLSTPARTVYDASSKTSTGLSLNDVLATGIPDLVRLLDILLDWHIGPAAFVGDVSQFYCSIGMEEESWPYQKLLLREDLNPNGKVKMAVIVSTIFGVCSSGGQSEEVIRKFCEIIKDEHPDVARLLLKGRYVDDMMKSMKSNKEVVELIKKTEDVLDKIKMKIKGWCISGEEPPEQLSEDKKSIQFSGMTWFPKIDSFLLNISSLHFGKKKRGKTSSKLDIYDLEKHGSIGEFLKDKELTRRQCTSVVARMYDMYGKLEPLKLRLKSDLRKLIKENPAWDDSITKEQKLRWENNFKMIQDCRDIMYMRCSVPENAVSLKAKLWILCDAAEDGIMVAAYVGFEIPGKRWSCSNILGKSLLAPEEWTIPKKELQALTTASNIKAVIERAMENWIDTIRVGSDSEIALAWCIYENVKLNVFHRNRVNNIRSKLSLDQLFHVRGSENCADIGTRADSITTESLLPGSPWLSGMEWMRKHHEDALKSGIIKSVQDIKLTNEAKKVMKEGIVFDQFEKDESNVAIERVNLIDVNKVAEREAFSRYIYPPLKRSFRTTVRIVSLIFMAIRKFKEGRVKRRVREGKADLSQLQDLKPDKVRFSLFHVVDNDRVGTKNDHEKKWYLTDMFGNGVRCSIIMTVGKGKKKKLKEIEAIVRLSEEELSVGLEYLFKKATQEILKFEKIKDVNKIGVMKDEILYCSTRILEGQELKAVGCLKESLDLESFTGIKFCVPLISRHSPLAVSIAMHIHYNTCKHKGVESTYRLSLQHARILQGKQLFKEVADDCIYCKKLRQRYVEQLMGPFSDTQLCISPIFYFTFIDMWGPLAVYCPGYEKKTRNRQQRYEVHVLVMACAVTGTVNCQIIEKKDTGAVLDGLNRFFNEVCVPKVCYPDKDGAIMKALKDGEVDVLDMQGRLHRERGIYFETCLPQGHYQHGRIERRIRMLQESLERSEMKKSRCTATGWQTICKAIEHEVNSVPMGFLHHQGSANRLLRVLCPNLLKSSTFSDRAPRGLFSIPNSVEDLMTKIESTYNMWYQVWNCEYLPLIMDRPKWQEEEENLKEQDLVYFKLTDSKLSADWRLGKVEYVNIGRDGKVRSVGVSYKIMVENNDKVYHEDFEWKSSVVERPARAVVKLMNIEDTSILEDMKKVEDLVKKILDNNTKSKNDLDSQENLDMVEADGHTADDAMIVKKTSDENESKTKAKKVERKENVNITTNDIVKKSCKKSKADSFPKHADEVKLCVQGYLINSISDEKQLRLDTEVVLEEVEEMVTVGDEVLDSKRADV